jgi:hypothetical protein
MASVLMQQSKHAEAESKLEQSRQEFGAGGAHPLCCLIVACQHQSKPAEALAQQLKATHPDHFLAKKGLGMVNGASLLAGHWLLAALAVSALNCSRVEREREDDPNDE